MQTDQDTFPLDWDEWRRQWGKWRQAHANDLKRASKHFPGKNFLADEILGTWDVKGRTVELSEVTFPNLTERDDRGHLIRDNVRGVGITFAVGESDGGTVVHSFAELEQALGLT